MRSSAELRRRLLGISAEEIRYTFEDVRAEHPRRPRGAEGRRSRSIRKDIDALPSRQDRPAGRRSRSLRRSEPLSA